MTWQLFDEGHRTERSKAWISRSIRRLLTTVATCTLTSVPAYATTVNSESEALIRFPSSCGDDIVFSARGQVWSVSKSGGVARMLTSGMGNRQATRCSPDGRWIAFTAVVGADRDVYVMPRKGGGSRRLTFRPDITNWVVSWTPDSRSVVILSPQKDWSGRKLSAYAVPIAGGLPVALSVDRSGDLSFGPSGRRIAYTRFLTDYVNWKRYDGGQAPDIFL